MKIDRLLSIVVYLLNRELVSASELADKFEVSVRTIQRDMEAIDLAGIPVVTVQGPRGGYGIMKTFKLDRQLVSPEDIFYIITALKSISDSIDNPKLENTLEKMKGLMPGVPGESFLKHSSKLHIDFTMLGGGPDQKRIFQIINTAVEKEKLLRISYTNNKLEKDTRIIEPMTIVFKWRAWYLYAWCRSREDYRFFRISRIREPEILERGFIRRDQGYEEFESRNSYGPTGTGSGSIEIKLHFKTPMTDLVEEYYDEKNCEKLDDGSIICTVSMPEDGWLYGYILSFGEYVEVLSPPHLRKIIKEGAKKISEVYD